MSSDRSVAVVFCASLFVVLTTVAKAHEMAIRGKQSTANAMEWPSKLAIPGVYDEVEIDSELANLPTAQNASELVRRHKNALHAMTPQGVKAVLPYFIKAGMEAPGSGIMDHVMYFFTNDPEREVTLRKCLDQFSDDEIDVLVHSIRLFSDTNWSSIPDFVAQANRTIEDIKALRAQA